MSLGRRCESDRERTHEEVVCVRNVTADTEELHQVVELAVDVAAYLGRISMGEVSARAEHGRRTVTGALTVTTLPSSISSSLAL